MVRISLLCCLLAACHGAAPSTPSASAGAAGAGDAAFARLVDEYFESGARYSPTRAVGEGFHEHDAEIEDRSAGRIAQRIAELHGFADRLAAIDRGALG